MGRRIRKKPAAGANVSGRSLGDMDASILFNICASARDSWRALRLTSKELLHVVDGIASDIHIRDKRLHICDLKTAVQGVRRVRNSGGVIMTRSHCKANNEYSKDLEAKWHLVHRLNKLQRFRWTFDIAPDLRLGNVTGTRLKELYLIKRSPMYILGSSDSGVNVEADVDLSSLRTLTGLDVLEVRNCRTLNHHAIAHLTSLTRLVISGDRFQRSPGMEHGTLELPPSVKVLDLTNSDSILSGTQNSKPLKLVGLSGLHEFCTEGVDYISNDTSWMKQMTSLTRLRSSTFYLEQDVMHLTALKRLEIYGVRILNELMFSEQLPESLETIVFEECYAPIQRMLIGPKLPNLRLIHILRGLYRSMFEVYYEPGGDNGTSLENNQLARVTAEEVIVNDNIMIML